VLECPESELIFIFSPTLYSVMRGVTCRKTHKNTKRKRKHVYRNKKLKFRIIFILYLILSFFKEKQNLWNFVFWFCFSRKMHHTEAIYFILFFTEYASFNSVLSFFPTSSDCAILFLRLR
jgi:hypothetical protein